MTPAPRELDRPFFAPLPLSRREAAHTVPGMTPDIIRAQDLAVRHRKFDCPNYSSCLDHAAKRRWQGFSCIGCTGG